MASPACVKGPSIARSFIQIAKRGYSSTASRSSAPLEFLLPRSPATSDCHTTFIRSSIHECSRNAARSASFTRSIQHPQRRAFSVTTARKATECVLNPQQDEDGNEMVLEITPRAAKRLSEIMKKDGNPNLALRIQVESGGCHGFQYLMSLVTIPAKDAQEWSSVVNEDDSIFQFQPDDATALGGGARVILDEPSLDLLKGSKVDFTMELIGSQFKITDNPYATSSCGCGTSFDIKM